MIIKHLVASSTTRSYLGRFYTYPIGSAPDPCDGDASGDTYQAANGIWSAYQAIHHICYGRDWKNDVITDATRFLTDVPKGS